MGASEMLASNLSGTINSNQKSENNELKEALLNSVILKYKYGKDPQMSSNTSFFIRKFLKILSDKYYHAKLLLFTEGETILLHFGLFKKEENYDEKGNEIYYNWYEDGGIQFGKMTEYYFVTDETIIEEYINCKQITIKKLLEIVTSKKNFNRKSYSLLKNNCQHFVKECMEVLQGELVQEKQLT